MYIIIRVYLQYIIVPIHLCEDDKSDFDWPFDIFTHAHNSIQCARYLFGTRTVRVPICSRYYHYCCVYKSDALRIILCAKYYLYYNNIKQSGQMIFFLPQNPILNPLGNRARSYLFISKSPTHYVVLSSFRLVKAGSTRYHMRVVCVGTMVPRYLYACVLLVRGRKVAV